MSVAKRFVLFLFWPKLQTASRKWTLFIFTSSHIVYWLICIAIWWQHVHCSTCPTMEIENTRKWQVEAWLATHAALNQGMSHKLQQAPKKATTTPVGIFIMIKVFTCLSNSACLNAVADFSECDWYIWMCLIKARLNCCLHGDVLFGVSSSGSFWNIAAHANMLSDAVIRLTWVWHSCCSLLQEAVQYSCIYSLSHFEEQWQRVNRPQPFNLLVIPKFLSFKPC